MLNKVASYAKNLTKSVLYTATDVTGEIFTKPKSFVDENAETFKSSYNAIRDYRTTFKRVKERIQKSSIYVAADVGINSLIEDIKTGDWYAKDREEKLTEKYGGMGLGDDWDMDNSDFDWSDDKFDISDGDKVIATAIKKNSKINTMLTTDAIATVGKASIEASRENTTLMYIQNQKLANSVESGFGRISSILTDTANTSIKNQQKTWEKTAKFYEKIESNTNTIVAQLDELLKMQRNLYENQRQKENEKKRERITASSVVNADGMINLSQYKQAIKKNINSLITESTGFSLDSLNMGDGNMLALIAANPMREITKSLVKRSMPKHFKQTSANLNEILGNVAYTAFGQLNNMNKNGEGLNKILGKIFGVTMDREERIDTSKYVKGPVPFDGVTKKYITEVIPHYLSSMTAALTGGDEEIFNPETGRWTTKKARYEEKVKYERNKAMNAMGDFFSYLKESVGGDFSKVFGSNTDYKNLMEGLRQFANAMYENPDFNMLVNPREYGIDPKVATLIQKAFKDDKYRYRMTRYRSRKMNGAERDLTEQRVAGLDWDKGNPILTNRDSRTRVLSDTIKSIFDARKRNADASTDNVSFLDIIFASEGIDINKNSAKEWISKYRNKYGDYDKTKMANSPVSRAIAMAADSYGNTIFDYLAHIKKDLTAIRNNSVYSIILGGGSAPTGGRPDDGVMNFEVQEKYDWERLKKRESKDREREDERYRERYDRELEKWNQNEQYKKKGDRRYDPRIRKPKRVSSYNSDDFNKEITNIINDYTDLYRQNERERLAQEEADKKDLFDRLAEFDFIKDEDKEKLRAIKYDKNKSMKEQMKEAKDAKEKILLTRSFAMNLANKPWQAATDAMVSTEAFIYDIFFSEAFKIRDEDGDHKVQGLFGLMKDRFQKGFDDLTVRVSEKFDKFFNNNDPKSLWNRITKKIEESRIGEIWENIVGKKDDDGFRQGGWFGSLWDALKKNAADVAEMAKRDAAELTGKNKKNEDEEENKNNGNPPTPPSPLKNDWWEKDNEKQEVKTYVLSSFISSVDFGDKISYANEYIEWAKKRKLPKASAKSAKKVLEYFTKQRKPALDEGYFIKDNVNSPFGLDRKRILDREANQKAKDTLKNNIRKSDTVFLNNCRIAMDALDPASTSAYLEFLKANGISAKDMAKDVGNYDPSITTLYTEYAKKYISKLTSIHIKEYVDQMRDGGDTRTRLQIAKEYIADRRASQGQDEELNRNNNALERLNPILEKVTGPLDKIANALDNLLKGLGKGTPSNNPPADDTIGTTAYGGIAKSNMRSVLSPGEIVMSRSGTGVVPKMGVYGLSKGDVVINPASPSKAASQYAAEKSYSRRIMHNAKADEGTEKLGDSVINWLNSDKSKTAADYVAKAGIGGVLGAFLGLPLLGAGVGVAAGLSKRSTGFANEIFGEMTESGERLDNGLISAELQKAFPSMRKGALVGGIASLFTPLGLLGGVLLGSAVGVAEHEKLFDNLIFGEDSLLGDKEKFKKKLPKIGLGALAGAVFSPIGLLPGALLGSAAGFVASGDKFKEMVFGKEGEDGKKHGGFVGLLKKSISPLKTFGQDFIESVMTAVFGKKVQQENGEEKREGGLIGDIKDFIIKPFAEGATSIAQSFKNVAADIRDKFLDVIGDKFADKFGENLAARIVDTIRHPLRKLVGGAVKVGGRVVLSPFMAGAHMVKSIGNRLERGRIREGKAFNKTAEERLQYREAHKFGFGYDVAVRGRSGDVESVDRDIMIADAVQGKSASEILEIETALEALSSKDPFRSSYNRLKTDFSNLISEYMNVADAGRVVKLLRWPAPDYKAAAKFIRTKAKAKDGRTPLTKEDQEFILKSLDNFKKNADLVFAKSKIYKNTSRNDIIDNLEKLGIKKKYLKNDKSIANLAKNFHTEYNAMEDKPEITVQEKIEEKAQEGVNLLLQISNQLKTLIENRTESDQIKNAKSARDKEFERRKEAKIKELKEQGLYDEATGLTQDQIDDIKKEMGYLENDELEKNEKKKRASALQELGNATLSKEKKREILNRARELRAINEEYKKNGDSRYDPDFDYMASMDQAYRDFDQEIVENATHGKSYEQLSATKAKRGFIERRIFGIGKLGTGLADKALGLASHAPIVGAGIDFARRRTTSKMYDYLKKNQKYYQRRKGQKDVNTEGFVNSVLDDAYFEEYAPIIKKEVDRCFKQFTALLVKTNKKNNTPDGLDLVWRGKTFRYDEDDFVEFLKYNYFHRNFQKELDTLKSVRKKDYKDFIIKCFKNDKELYKKISDTFVTAANETNRLNAYANDGMESFIPNNAFVNKLMHPIRTVKNFFSGVKNKIVGSKDTHDEEHNGIGAKILERLDDIKANTTNTLKDKLGFGDNSNKGSLLKRLGSKAIKFALFAPLLVGLYKQFVKPWVKNHLMPFFKDKLGPLFLGTAEKKIDDAGNEVVEYSGGMFSGLANILSPAMARLKGFLKGTRDWIFNKGEYSSPEKGSSGLIHTLVDVWKVGFDSIMVKLPAILDGAGDKLGVILEKVFAHVMTNSIPLTIKGLGYMVSGAVTGIKNILLGNSKEAEENDGTGGLSILDGVRADSSIQFSGVEMSEEDRRKLDNAAKINTVTNPFTGRKTIFAISKSGEIETIRSSESNNSFNKLNNYIDAMSPNGSTSKISVAPDKKIDISTADKVSTSKLDYYYAPDDEKHTTPIVVDPETGEQVDMVKAAETLKPELKEDSLWNRLKNTDYKLMDGYDAPQDENDKQSRWVASTTSMALGGKTSPYYTILNKFGIAMQKIGQKGATTRLPHGGIAGRVVAKSTQTVGALTETTSEAIATGSLDPFKKLPSLLGNGDKAAKVAANTGDDAARTASTANKSGLAGKISNLLKKAMGYFKNLLAKPLSKLTGNKINPEHLDNIPESAYKESGEKLANSVAKEGTDMEAAASKVTETTNKIDSFASFLQLFITVTDYVYGETHAADIMGVAAELGVSDFDRKICGFANTWCGLLPFLNVEEVVAAIYSLISKVPFAKNLAKDLEEKKKKTAKIIKEYNDTHGTNYDLSQVNHAFEIKDVKKTLNDNLKRVSAEQSQKGTKMVTGVSDLFTKGSDKKKAVADILEGVTNVAGGGIFGKFRKLKDARSLKDVKDILLEDSKKSMSSAGQFINDMDESLAANGIRDNRLRAFTSGNDAVKSLFSGDFEDAGSSALESAASALGADAVYDLVNGDFEDAWHDTKAYKTYKGAKYVASAAEDKLDDFTDTIGSFLPWNAKADQNMNKFDPSSALNPVKAITGFVSDAISEVSLDGAKLSSAFRSLNSRNASINKRIDNGTVTPFDKKYWEVNLGSQNTSFEDSMFNLKESITRTIKAPFSIVSGIMKDVTASMSGSGEDITSTTTSTSSNKSTTATKSTLDISSKIKNILSKYGKGKDDPQHIYQRNYNEAYKTAGDNTNQTLADSGCGPAAAATVARIFGNKNANISEAGRYAMRHKYKEVNGGTYPEFFSSYLGEKGIGTRATNSNVDVLRSLVHHKPVVLMGNDPTNSGKTPYGADAHYVVATGIDKNGKVIVEDSESRTGGDRYSLADTLAASNVKITTGRGKDNTLSNFISNTSGAIIVPFSKTLSSFAGLVSDKKKNSVGTVSGVTSSASTSSTRNYKSEAELGDTSSASARETAIWKYFKSKGYSDNLAAGIMGNMYLESAASFHPNVSEGEYGDTAGSHNRTVTWGGSSMYDGYAGYGICQWTFNYSHAALYNWCNAHNLSPDSLLGQLEYCNASLRGIDMNKAIDASDPGGFGCDGSGVMSVVYNEFKNGTGNPNPSEGGGSWDQINKLSLRGATDLWLCCFERPGASIYQENISLRYANAQAIYKRHASGTGKIKSKLGKSKFNTKFGKGRFGRARTLSDADELFMDILINGSYPDAYFNYIEDQSSLVGVTDQEALNYVSRYNKLKDKDGFNAIATVYKNNVKNKGIEDGLTAALTALYNNENGKSALTNSLSRIKTALEYKKTKENQAMLEVVYKFCNSDNSLFRAAGERMLESGELEKVTKEAFTADTLEEIGFTTSDSSSESTSKKSLLEILGEDIANATKKLYGPYYEALYGDIESSGPESSSSSSSLNSGTTPVMQTDFKGIVAPFKGKFTCTSEFGENVFHTSPHNGVDLCRYDDASDNGWMVYSLCDGIITTLVSQYAPNSGKLGSGDGGGYGNYVEVTTTEGYVFQYCHLNQVNGDLKVGDTVYVGTVIGIGGHTGSSSGRHLHFGIYKLINGNRQFYDPAVMVMGFTADNPIKQNTVYTSNLTSTGKGKGNKKINFVSGKGKTSIRPGVPSYYKNDSNKFDRMKRARDMIYDTFGSTSDTRKIITELNKLPPAQLIQSGDPIFNSGNKAYIRESDGTITVDASKVRIADPVTGRGKTYEAGQRIPLAAHGSNINISMESIVDILKVIAENSERNSQIVQLLSAIVSNTANMGNSNANTKDILKILASAGSVGQSTSAPITSLNSILNGSINRDVSDAVYKIARS